MEIKLKNICKAFDDKIIYDNFNMEFKDDKINTILGESGGGKSTLLNMIASLTNIDSGTIEGINDKKISYVFQENRLIPWLTIEKNMNLFLNNYYSKEEANNKLNQVFSLLNISDTKKEYPRNLSGGMKQRVNIARALLKPSQIVLMDEPFKSLDYKIKYSIMGEIKEIFKKEKRMVLFVTHDVDEAIFMEGRVIVLKGSPYKVEEIFEEKLEENKEKIIKII